VKLSAGIRSPLLKKKHEREKRKKEKKRKKRKAGFAYNGTGALVLFCVL
jgi:hypothetical protein